MQSSSFRRFSHQSWRTSLIANYPAPSASDLHAAKAVARNCNRPCPGYNAYAIVKSHGWSEQFGIVDDHYRAIKKRLELRTKLTAFQIIVTTMSADYDCRRQVSVQKMDEEVGQALHGMR
nr:hypothetical protein [Mesorhizobium ciceri]